MSTPWETLRTLAQVGQQAAPVVVDLIGQLVHAIANSPDPEATARRALEEAARVKAFDEAMRERSRAEFGR
jgi:hypothetical protein